MTEPYDDDEDPNRPRILTNSQVLGFIVRHWLAEPRKFALIVGLNLGHSPHGWIYDRTYDACMATAGDDDWKCEDFMPNPI